MMIDILASAYRSMPMFIFVIIINLIPFALFVWGIESAISYTQPPGTTTTST